MMLQNKSGLLGAGGGPLTWVAVDVLRAVQRAGAQVQVVLSAETEAFVPALTFQTLTGGEVVPADAMYGMLVGDHFRPLSTVVEQAEAMAVVPATPALLAKAAAGCADEALVRALLLHRGPVVFAYPGQAAVYQHTLVQHNLQRLRAAGIQLCDAGIPDPAGASDELGWSLSVQSVLETVAACLPQATPLTEKVILIT